LKLDATPPMLALHVLVQEISVNPALVGQAQNWRGAGLAESAPREEVMTSDIPTA
jgi:hypothetical protein